MNNTIISVVQIAPRVGLARQTGPGNLVWLAHIIQQKTPTYHSISVVAYNSRNGHPRFALKMAKFDLLPKTSELTDLKNIWQDWLRHQPE